MTDAKKSDDDEFNLLIKQAISQHREKKYDAAASRYRKYLAFRPENASAWALFATLLRAQGHHDPSIAAYRRALEIDPELRVARYNMSKILVEQGRYEEAIDFFRAEFEADPDDPEKLRELCATLRGLGRHDEIIRIVDDMEARVGPTDAVIMQRSISHLMNGNWAQGFRDYEARYAGDEVNLPGNAPWPRWAGEDLTGRKILIVPEQGFGDAIVMARFMPALKAHGGEVTMHVKPPLRRLFSRLEGLDKMVAEARASHETDYYLPNMSLAHRLGMPDGKPPPMPRLHIPEDSRARARLLTEAHNDRFRIGVVWTGSHTYRSNNRRSTTPESFLGLAGLPGVQLFSLYKGHYHDDFLKSGMAGLIIDACATDRDFADTAAIIEKMDLMITTDTAVVHLAASLGKPVWNLLSREGYWLYGHGETTPWYPSMRLFRKKPDGDWAELFGRVEAELRRHLKELGR